MTIEDFVKIYLPRCFRDNTIVAFISALLHTISNNYGNFFNFREKMRYEISVTPQTIWLEKMLNDWYNADGSYSDIYITDMDNYPVYIGNSDEIPITYIGNSDEIPVVYVGNSSEYITSFIVHIPIGLYNVLVADGILNKLIDDVNRFKCYYKQIQIQTF